MTSHRSHTSAQPGTGLVTGLGERFETHRPRLTSIAYRMLGSVGEAEDAVQDAWLRLSRADVSTIRDLEGWLITAVARVSIDHLRSRRARAQEANRLPDPIVVRDDPIDPEAAALLSEALGLAFMVYPYFVHSVLWMWVIAAAAIAGIYALARFSSSGAA